MGYVLVEGKNSWLGGLSGGVTEVGMSHNTVFGIYPDWDYTIIRCSQQWTLSGTRRSRRKAHHAAAQDLRTFYLGLYTLGGSKFSKGHPSSKPVCFSLFMGAARQHGIVSWVALKRCPVSPREAQRSGMCGASRSRSWSEKRSTKRRGP